MSLQQPDVSLRQPAVTVVIPTYQRREQVRRAVGSVLAQTRPDFELVVVDDGSTDGTSESLAGIDPRITIERREHRGFAAARNAGAAAGRAPVIAFLDSDDEWLPQHLATVLGMLARNPEAVLASTCRRLLVRGARRARHTVVVDVFAESLLSNVTGLPSCVAVRRAAFEQVGGLDESLPAQQDDDLFARLAAIGPFAFLDRRTTIRHLEASSAGRASAASGATLAMLELRSRRIAAELELSSDPGRRRLAQRAAAACLLAQAFSALDVGSDDTCRQMLAEACELEPALHDHAELISFRLRHYLPSVTDAGTYASACRRCADAWPDQSAVTAQWLRIQALAAGLEARQPSVMAEAVLSWRPGGSARLLRRAARRPFRAAIAALSR